MRADNSRHLLKAAQQRAAQTRQRAVAALRRMDATGKPISFESVAREAGVSRSWLYAQTDLRLEVERLRARHPSKPSSKVLPQRQQASDTSLLRRLEAASERIRLLERDNRELRDALAQALGDQRTSAILGTNSRRDTPNKKPIESDRTVLTGELVKTRRGHRPQGKGPGQSHDQQGNSR